MKYIVRDNIVIELTRITTPTNLYVNQNDITILAPDMQYVKSIHITHHDSTITIMDLTDEEQLVYNFTEAFLNNFAISLSLLHQSCRPINFYKEDQDDGSAPAQLIGDTTQEYMVEAY